MCKTGEHVGGGRTGEPDAEGWAWSAVRIKFAMRQTCERAGYRRLNFAGRQPPVFRKAVPSVFAFPLHLDCIVPIQKDIRLSDYPTLPYRGVRHYRIALPDILVSGCPILPYRAYRYSRIGAGGRGYFTVQIQLVGRPPHVCHAANVRAGCGGGRNKFHATLLWYRLSASRFAERNVQDGRRLNFVDCQPTVFPFLSLSLKPTSPSRPV